MATHPKISIITPSLNQGQFIEDAILSVKNQNYPNFEHIVIDGGSTDNTLEVLEKYPHLIWVSEPDKGQSDAINKGFRRATGDIMAWLNADDYYLPDALKKITEFWSRHPEADVVYGDCIFVDQNGKYLRNKREPDFDYRMLLYYGCYIPSTSTFFKRSIIYEGHLLDTTYHNCMDFEYFMRLANSSKIFKHFRADLAAFRWHESNVSTTYAQRRREERLKVQFKYGVRLFKKNEKLSVIVFDMLARVYTAKHFIVKLAHGLR